MNGQALGDRGVDGVEETAELDGAVLRAQVVDDLAGGQVQGREQIGDAVALVVMRAALASPRQ